MRQENLVVPYEWGQTGSSSVVEMSKRHLSRRELVYEGPDHWAGYSWRP